MSNENVKAKTNNKTTFELCPNPLTISFNTNWNIRLHPSLKIIIESTIGVEEICAWGLHKYNFLVIIGACFNRNDLIVEIKQKIDAYFLLENE